MELPSHTGSVYFQATAASIKQLTRVGRLFQETFGRNLNEKYSALNGQLDKLIHDANTEISNLRTKLETMLLEREGIESKCFELGEAYREKSRKCLQFQVRPCH